jgi:hypothetical protein
MGGRCASNGDICQFYTLGCGIAVRMDLNSCRVWVTIKTCEKIAMRSSQLLKKLDLPGISLSKQRSIFHLDGEKTSQPTVDYRRHRHVQNILDRVCATNLFACREALHKNSRFETSKKRSSLCTREASLVIEPKPKTARCNEHIRANEKSKPREREKNVISLCNLQVMSIITIVTDYMGNKASRDRTSHATGMPL